LDLATINVKIKLGMPLQILDPTQYPNWDQLLISIPGSSFFHTSAWARVLKEAYGYTPKYFTEFNANRISTLMPIMEVRSSFTGRKGISLPFTDYCDPIVSDGINFQEAINCVLVEGKERNWKYLELRNIKDLSPFAFPSLTYLGHTLNLSNKEDQIFFSFRDSTRRNIKKAVKKGVKAEILNSLESVKKFYELNCMTRKQHGLPPQPFSFFEKMHGFVVSNNLGHVILGSYGQKAIAGAVFFHFGNKAVFKYGASDMAYQGLRANNLVMWEGIKWYSQKGYKSLCFGRTEPENRGLIQFKSGWGTTEQKINYYHYDFRKQGFISATSRVTGFHNKIFRRMPIPLLRALGSIYYKHLG